MLRDGSHLPDSWLSGRELNPSILTLCRSACVTVCPPSLVYRLQTNVDYTITAQFLACMGYSVLQKNVLASALQGTVCLYRGNVCKDNIMCHLV